MVRERDERPDRTSGENAVSFGYHVRALARGIDRSMAARIGALALTLPQYHVLRELYVEEGLTQRELSARLNLGEPGTLAILRRMEAGRLVRRVRDAVDRRKINVYLAPRGENMRERLRAAALEVNALARNGFAPDELIVFRSMLERMHANVQPAATPA